MPNVSLNAQPSSSTSAVSYWVVVPAAGVGARMGSDIPKQYLLLDGETILEHTLQRLLAIPFIAGIVVALANDDSRWPSLSISQHPLIHRVEGASERAGSVLNGLNYLQDKLQPQDWVLVHDAARPCVSLASIALLCESLQQDPVGGILAVAVCDTLKQVGPGNSIQNTVDRRLLWRAQTPQLFRHKLLRDCLLQAEARGETVTDEASALEVCGYSPKVIEGREDNIKITRPEDLLLAAFILQQQKKLEQQQEDSK
jgi:2-C-methyl-D-erythritol 4-phosphate cytidylyltransferase